MDIDIRRDTGRKDRPLTRADVERLLQKVGSPDKLDLSLENLERVDLSYFNLSGANLGAARLSYANLSNSDLSGANLSSATLSNSDLRGANLSGASLIMIDLNNSDLRGANLSGTDLRDAELIGANLSNANLSGVILSENEREQLRGRGAIGLFEPVQTTQRATTLRIRITEEPLTAHNLATIVSAFTELSIKCWLITKSRFADLIEYTQTHNPRFAEEANTIITRASYNSPFTMDWKMDISAQGLAEGITQIALIKKTLEKAELENQEKVQAIKHDQQKAEQERQAVQLVREKQELEIERQRLELLEKRLETQKKQIEYALEIANKLVDVLQPSADQAARAMTMQVLLPNILQIQNGKGLELVLLGPQSSEEKIETIKNGQSLDLLEPQSSEEKKETTENGQTQPLI
jgi:uncharacterized protein YjbI with pentapeptide repeats